MERLRTDRMQRGGLVQTLANFLFNITGGIRVWGWKGNERLGDCVAAAIEDLIQAKGTATASTWRKVLYRLGFTPPSNRRTVQLYTKFLATLNELPSATQGIDPATFLEWLRVQGEIVEWSAYPIGQDRTLSAVQAGYTYGGAVLTLALTENMYNGFTDNHPWGIGNGPGNTPLWALNHAVALVRNTGKELVIATWDRNKVLTDPCADATITAIYAVLTKQDQWRANFTQLAAQLLALRTGATTDPTPAP